MLNFFKKTAQDIESPESKANDSIVAITYYIEEGSKNPKIDIHIKDYLDSTIESLADMLCVLDSGQAMHVTLELVRDGLEENGVPDKFIGIATKLAMLRVANRTEEEIEIEDEDSNEEEPMIKPSDMM
tara:strand:+ start:28 stop:411 length:384 start_codon:yes stop_codon:yes gene_type:complete